MAARRVAVAVALPGQERASAGRPGPPLLPGPPLGRWRASTSVPSLPPCRSLAYLHHLVKAHEPLAATLLAIHNIHHMNAQASCALSRFPGIFFVWSSGTYFHGAQCPVARVLHA